MVKNLDEETGEQYKTIIIGGKKIKVPVLFVLPEEHGEKEIEAYEHPEVNVGKVAPAAIPAAVAGTVARGVVGGVANAVTGAITGDDAEKAADSKEEPLDKLTDGKLEEVEKEPQPSQQNIRDEGQAILDQKVPDTKIGAPPKQSQISLDTAIANKINALAIQVKVNRLVAKKEDYEKDIEDLFSGADEIVDNQWHSYNKPTRTYTERYYGDKDEPPRSERNVDDEYEATERDSDDLKRVPPSRVGVSSKKKPELSHPSELARHLDSDTKPDDWQKEGLQGTQAMATTSAQHARRHKAWEVWLEKKDDWDDKESDRDKKYIKGDKGEESGLYDELENPKDLKNIDDESLEYGKRVGVRPNSWGGTRFDVETDKKTGKPIKVTPSRVVGTDPHNSNPNSALANDARYSDGSEAQNISQRNADKWKAAVEALKDAIKPSKGQLKEGNQPKEYEYEQAPSFEIGGRSTDSYEYAKAPDNEFQRQSTDERGRELEDSSHYDGGLEKLVGAQNIGVLTHPSDRDNKVRQKLPKHIADAEKSWEVWLAKKEEQTTFDDEENVDPLHAEAKKRKKEVWDKARRDGIGMTWDSQERKQ